MLLPATTLRGSNWSWPIPVLKTRSVLLMTSSAPRSWPPWPMMGSARRRWDFCSGTQRCTWTRSTRRSHHRHSICCLPWAHWSSVPASLSAGRGHQLPGDDHRADGTTWSSVATQQRYCDTPAWAPQALMSTVQISKAKVLDENTQAQKMLLAHPEIFSNMIKEIGQLSLKCLCACTGHLVILSPCSLFNLYNAWQNYHDFEKNSQSYIFVNHVEIWRICNDARKVA